MCNPDSPSPSVPQLSEETRMCVSACVHVCTIKRWQVQGGVKHCQYLSQKRDCCVQR